MQPRLLQLRRLVIGEAGRFPELGRTFYERGPGRTMAAPGRAPSSASPRGRCSSSTTRALAAAHFNWLSCRSRSTGDAARRRRAAGEADLDRYAEAACGCSSPPTPSVRDR